MLVQILSSNEGLCRDARLRSVKGEFASSCFYLLGVLLGTLNGPFQASFSLSLLNTECNVLGKSSQFIQTLFRCY